jgi:hypothetical protein
MSKQWTTERVNKLLHLIIQKHVTGTPDYNYLAAELGCTYQAVRQKWAIIRRELDTISTTNNGNPTPPATPQKRKANRTQGVKGEGGKDHLDEVSVKVERKAPSENMVTVHNTPTPHSESPKKRKVSFKSAVKIEDSDSDDQEYTAESVSVKKVRTARGAAMKAADKIKKDYEMPWGSIE